MPGGVELGAQVEDEVRVGRRREFRRRVVGLERRQHFLGVVHEIEHVGRVLAGMRAVQAGERLHGLDAGEPLVDVHAAQQRLIEAGLELVGDEQDLILVALEGFADVAALQVRVERRAGFGEGIRARFLVVHLAGERHQRADLVAVLLDVFVDGELPAHGLHAAADDHHRLGLAVEQRRDVFAEVLDDDLHLLRDVVGVQPHPAHDPLHGRAALDLLLVVILAVVRQLEGQLVGRVVLQHVEDELLLDGLPHRIDVERLRQIVRAGWFARGIGPRAEQLHRLGLRRRGERDERDAAVLGPRRHLRGEDVFRADFAAVVQFLQLLGREHRLQLRRRLAGLGAVRLVGDHGEALALRGGQLAHGFQREGERLDRADDDLLVAGKRLGQLAALAAVVALDRGDHAGRPLEVEDRFLKLRVDHVAVGDDEHGVEHLLVLRVVQLGEEVGRPRDGVRLARAGRVLDEILACPAPSASTAAWSLRVTSS